MKNPKRLKKVERLLKRAKRLKTPETKAGNFVRSRRLFLGITQRDLANALGVRANFISEIETGKRSIPAARMSAFRKLLKVRGTSLELAIHEDFISRCA